MGHLLKPEANTNRENDLTRSTAVPKSVPNESKWDSPVGQLQPALIRCREAARFLGISEWLIRDMAHKGELPYIQRGSYSSPMLFDVADLRQWIEKQKVRP